METYELIDSGGLKKLEQFGPVRLVRPCPVAVWETQHLKQWSFADAEFTRETEGEWKRNNPEISSWRMSHGGLHFRCALTEFGNIGIFPEHAAHWEWMEKNIARGVAGRRQIFVLNLFGYTGGASLAAARAGACVCHVDASKTSVAWARENGQFNAMGHAPIRWIVDDAMEFVEREIRRNRKYDGIILDPPTFGRGPKGQLFKIEHHLAPLLEACIQLLSEKPLFILLTCHTPGFGPTVLHHLMKQKLSKIEGHLEYGEMTLPSKENSFNLPAGSFSRWESVW